MIHVRGHLGPLPNLDGEFELGARLGEGGGGSVFEAIQVSLQRKVAIKRLHAWRTEGAESRFRDEATLMGRVAHPNIVPVLMHGDLDGAPALVMERVDGLDLRVLLGQLKGAGVGPSVTALGAALDSNTLPWPDDTPWWKVAASFIAQLARALDHAHRCGVLHRDIKPSNVLLSKAGAAHLTDFGIALPDSAGEPQSSRLEATSGNLGYCSPEELDGQRSTPRSDIFSLGIVARELVSLETPYPNHDSSVAARMLHIAEGRIQPLDRRLPSDLRAVLDAATAHHPEDRYPSADDFARDLENVCADRAVSVQPEGQIRRWQRWWSRHGKSAGPLLALGALLIGVPIAIQWSRLAAARQIHAAAIAARAHLELAVDEIGDLLVGVAAAGLEGQPLAEAQRAALLASGAQLGRDLAASLGPQSAREESSKVVARIFALRARSLADLVDVERRTGQLQNAVEHIKELRSFGHMAPEGAVTNLNARLQFQEVIVALQQGDLEGTEQLALAALNDIQHLDAQDDELRKFVANIWNARVEAALAKADHEAATEYGAAAVKAGRQWLKNVTPKAVASRELSRVLGNYSAALIETGEMDKADIHSREALALLEPLPRSYQVEHIEAIHWNNIGATLKSRGKRHEAEAAERRALDIQRRHLVAYPRSIFYRLSAGRTYFRLGLLLLGEEGREADTEEHFAKACEVFESLCDEANPTWLQHSLLAQSRCQLGVIRNGANDPRRAHEHFGRAVTAFANAEEQRPNEPSIRPMRLFAWQCYVGLTLHFDGEAGLAELMRYGDEFPTEPQVLRNVASMLCHLASKVLKSGDGTDPDRARRVAGYYADALDSLRKAADLGGLPLKILESHPTWKPLHGLPGFEELGHSLR